MKYRLFKTEQFQSWERNLRDRTAQKAIARRLARIESGNLGDAKTIAGDIREIRIFSGPGYRLYFTVRQRNIILLLCGGDKSSQKRDIQQARQIAASVDNQDENTSN